MKYMTPFLLAALPLAAMLPLRAQSGQQPTASSSTESEFPPAAAELVEEYLPPAPKEFSKEVAEAPVHARAIAKQAGERGANLVMELVAPPAADADEVPSSSPARPVNVAPWTAEEREARRAAAPDRILLFTPSITLFDGGISRIAWSATFPNPGGGPPRFEDYVVWAPVNLESIRAVGDLMVGKTRWLLSPSVTKAASQPQTASPAKGTSPGGSINHQPSAINSPTLADFNGPGGPSGSILVEKGNAELSEGLEPVMALMAKYQDPAERARIAEDFAKMTAMQAAAEAWAKEHPEPVRDTVIKFWPVESTEYPTASVPAPAAGRASAPVLPLPAAPAVLPAK